MLLPTQHREALASLVVMLWGGNASLAPERAFSPLPWGGCSPDGGQGPPTRHKPWEPSQWIRPTQEQGFIPLLGLWQQTQLLNPG